MKRTILALAALLLILAPLPLRAKQTVIRPDAAVMRLDDIGIYEIGLAYRGKREERFPDGWSGDFDDRTGIACKPMGEQDGKRAFLLHCPWRGGTGITFQQFTFALPHARSIHLRGAVAMRADIVTKSDGATFRVFANGRKLLDVNRTDAAWQPFDFDLTDLAGTKAVIRFETDPGPRDDPSWDYSLWGDRELVLDGFTPKPSVHAEPPPLDLRLLYSGSPTAGCAPAGGFAGRTSVQKTGSTVKLTYAGADGEMVYVWTPPRSAEDPPLGNIVLHAREKGGREVTVPVAAAANIRWSASAAPGPANWAGTVNSPTMVRPYRIGGETATIKVAGRLLGKSLVLDVTCDKPCVVQFDAGGWGPVVRRRPIPAPYYPGRLFYLPDEDLFVNAILDWTASNATDQDYVHAHYAPLTDGTRNRLRERVVFTAARHFAEVLPIAPNPPSPYRAALGNKIMLDIWGGRYTDIAKSLETLADYGIGPTAIIIHDWQRSGYDNALPAHLPAAADKGGDEGMKTLVSTATRLGDIISLHENYVDYYPNYDLFDENDIARDSEGKRQLAWYNPGTKIQSFAEKPDAILRLAATQSPEIHSRFGTNANYLDVHSAVPPWFHVDMRASEPGAGMFSTTWNVHRKLWAYERKTHNGPVFGEGNNHFYWSGCLDGVEAQFGVGWTYNGGLTAPLFVDFDLLRIHPLQLNHGMGYYERWWSESKWGGGAPPMAILDQYRMQEVAYGHMGFLSHSNWSNVPLAWLEHNLLTPVSARYATAKPAQIEYRVNGRWVDGTAAAKAGEWRQARITYDNGLTIAANDAEQPLTLLGFTLPRFGWAAKGAGVTAWTALRDGVACDYAETAQSLFANARSAVDWNNSGIRRIRPSVASFEQAGPRAFKVAYRWQVDDTLPDDYMSFVHFGNPGPDAGDEGIKFQADHDPARPTSGWKAGETVEDGPYTIQVPEALPDGDYEWTIGLYRPDKGRVSLLGQPDKTGRILLGKVHVRDAGATISFTPESRSGDDRLKLYSTNLNMAGKVIDFGTLRTDGSVKIRREGADWVLQTLPRDRAFTLELSWTRFGRPARIRCDGGAEPMVKAKPGASGFWSLPLNGAREYRWPAP
jgi:hypothetical protein